MIYCRICQSTPELMQHSNSHHTNNCPFIKTIRCFNCLEYGHTPKYCVNKRANLEKPDYNKLRPFFQESQDEFEVEMMERIYIYERNLNRIGTINHGMVGCCSFCKNSREYNINNKWMNNHSISMCPRLALVTCRSCGKKGHLDRYCPKNETVSNDMVEDDESFVLDFSIYDEEMDENTENACILEKLAIS